MEEDVFEWLCDLETTLRSAVAQLSERIERLEQTIEQLHKGEK